MEKSELNRRQFLVASGAAAGSRTVVAASRGSAPSSPEEPWVEQPFQIGVQYYRAPMPPQEMWDRDFAAIRESGFDSVRSFTSWNWMEPEPGVYDLSDFDLFFELAEKHGLKVVFDFTLSTHMACPDWMIRRHPDMRVVYHTGEVAQAFSNSATAQGGNRHCYDHPHWKIYGAGLIQAVVNRYKNSPALGMWTVWDGPSLPGRGNDVNRPGARPCYCVHTLAKYKRWLQERFTLDDLNQRLGRRYRSWEDVEAPRSNSLIMGMLLFQRFLDENIADTLRWQVEQVRRLDDRHELHCHGFRYPYPRDITCAPEADSWGFAAHSTPLIDSEDPYTVSNLAYASDWSRAVGKNNRWWYTEIYAGMYHGGLKYRKQTTPADLAISLWIGLIYGGAGAIFWQYRVEYATHEAPGLSLVSMEGEPLPRLKAVERTIRDIRDLQPHLPLGVPKSEVGLVYDPRNAHLAELEGASGQQWQLARGVHRTLWEHSIPVDLLASNMDWSGYKLIYLPNLMLLEKPVIEKIQQAVRSGTHIVADGLLGTNFESGRFSYQPPEGLADFLGVKVLDYSRIDDLDVRRGSNLIRTPHGEFPVQVPNNYAALIPQGSTKAWAHYGDEVIGIQSGGGQFTWITVNLGTAFGGLPPPPTQDLPMGHQLAGVAPFELLSPLLKAAGVQAPVTIEGDKVIVLERLSTSGDPLLFAFNLENKPADVKISPRKSMGRAQDLLTRRKLAVSANAISLQVPAREVKVVHYSA